VAEVTRS